MEKDNRPMPWTLADTMVMTAEIIIFLGMLGGSCLLYNHRGWIASVILGWIFLVSAMLLGWRAREDLKGGGHAAEGDSWIKTAAVVDSGVYGLVRHPMYVSFIWIAVGLAALSQHWLIIVLALILIVLIWTDMIREEKGSLSKLGKPYEEYMKRVPRMNILSGWLRCYGKTGSPR